MAFSTVTVYERKRQTTSAISPAGDILDCDYSDSEDEGYILVSNTTSHFANDSASDEEDDENDQQHTSNTSNAIGGKSVSNQQTSHKAILGC